MKFNIISIFIFCLFLALPVSAQIQSYNYPSEVKQDNSFLAEAYIQEVISIVNNNIRILTDKTFTVKALVRINKDGQIINLKLVESTNDTDLNYQITELIIDSGPFKPMEWDIKSIDALITINHTPSEFRQVPQVYVPQTYNQPYSNYQTYNNQAYNNQPYNNQSYNNQQPTYNNQQPTYNNQNYNNVLKRNAESQLNYWVQKKLPSFPYIQF